MELVGKKLGVINTLLEQSGEPAFGARQDLGGGQVAGSQPSYTTEPSGYVHWLLLLTPSIPNTLSTGSFAVFVFAKMKYKLFLFLCVTCPRPRVLHGNMWWTEFSLKFFGEVSQKEAESGSKQGSHKCRFPKLKEYYCWTVNISS